MAAQVRHYPVARVVEVHDGDTIRLDVDLGFSTHHYPWIRLRGVRAPELREAAGPQAKRDLEAWLATDAPDGLVEVATFQIATPAKALHASPRLVVDAAGQLKEIREQMTFIRYVGIVTSPHTGQELNAWLVARGYIDQGE